MHRTVLWIQTVLVPALGPLGVLLVAFLDSSFLSLPEINDILVVSAAAAAPASAWLVIAMATLGSYAGCAALWVLGRRGGEPLLVRQFGAERVERTRQAFLRWDVLALAVPAVLPPPMPFKVFVLAAGAFDYPFRRFSATILVARTVRYLFWGALGLRYGEYALSLLRGADRWFAARLPLLAGTAAFLVLSALLWRAWRRRREEGEEADPAL